MFFDPEWTQFILLLQEQMLALVFLSGMLWLGFRTCNKWVKSGCILAGTILVLTEWADAVLLWLLNERFSPGQIGEFGGEVLSSAWPFLKSYFSVTAGQYTLLFLGSWIILCVYLWRVRKPIDTQLRQLFGVVMVLGFLWYLLPADLTPAEKNQLVAWPRLWLHSKFPVKTITARVPEFQLTYQCADGLNSRQNVVIIVVESLSAYMSSYFSDGKANNWTPQLDKLAKQYASFTDYRATHPYTAQNLFSILTGIPAVHTYGASYLYRDPRFYRHTLAKIFQEDGYHTAFFTSAAVACSKDEILNRIGFDEMSNNTDIFYNGKKRFTFQSVADDVLYARAQEWMAHYNRPNPYLLILETTTTHPPYIDPLSGEKSLEKNVRYADNALGKFIADLAQKHILDNTLVLITSDHRSNTPLDSTQTRLFGPEAEARIPLVIIGSPLKGKQNGVFAHNDLAPSLAYLTLSRACFHPYQHNMFSPDSGHTSCTLFQSGIEKDTLLVNCQGKYGKIALVEDENVFHQGGQLSDEEKSSLLGFVNWIRDNGRY
jgi:glucan phosphoethanolaminetransferase (alkaline phosphatase superfamily)